MSVYTTLIVEATCPHCLERSEVLDDFRFGFRDQLEYRVGDRLLWEGKGVRRPGTRPPDGNFSGEAYTECPRCGRGFWLVVYVEGDVVVGADTDWERDEYPTL